MRKSVVAYVVMAIVVALVLLARSEGRRKPRNNKPIALLDVSSEMLQRAELVTLPAWESVKTANVIHAIRLWGDRGRGDWDTHRRGLPIYSGQVLMNYCLGAGVPPTDRIPGWQPILKRTEFGATVVRFPALRGGFAEGRIHRDDFLAACALNAVPLATPAYVEGEALTLHDLLKHSVATYHAQAELEWSAVVYSNYLPPQSAWMNRFGERADFDELVDTLIARRPADCACFGLHIPFALASIVSANERSTIISQRSRDKANGYLQRLAKTLEGYQDDRGFWPVYWWSPRATVQGQDIDLVLPRLTSLGHNLEWITIAPSTVIPSPDSINLAIRAADQLLQNLSPLQAESLYPVLTHYTRALKHFALNGTHHDDMQEQYFDMQH